MSETPIVSVQNLRKVHSGRLLFKDLSLGIFPGERIGMIGPNGAGKTTLLEILYGKQEADRGTRSAQRNSELSFVEQTPKFADGETVESYLFSRLNKDRLESDELPQVLDKAINQLGLKGTCLVSSLSGGWQKRLALIAELSRQPNLLFLDEPTNHLDFSGIRWLEKTLKSFNQAFLLISHDRSFLENVCNRIIEINPSYQEGYFSCPGNYSFFLQKRSEYFIALDRYEETLANKVRREVEWLRQGVKARTTKSKSRARAAHLMQGDLQDLKKRTQKKTTSIEFVSAGKNVKNLLEVKNLNLQFGSDIIFKDFNLSLKSGERLCLVGDNGVGKSCLLKILAGKLKADSGSIEWSPGTQIVYFDQNRESLNPDLSIQEFLCDSLGTGPLKNADSVTYLGRSLHVTSYARRFLFSAEHLHRPILQLSGGEKARLMIAKLMLNSADILLLDEPTNDLDIETMDVFAESLMEFPGTVLLVSHDRFFVEEISQRVLLLKKNQNAEFFADLRQWDAFTAKSQAPAKTKKVAKRSRLQPKKKLSYNEKREWEQMEEKILVAEEALDRWRSEVEKPTIAASPDKLKNAFEQMTQAQSLVDELYARWAELENKQLDQ